MINNIQSGISFLNSALDCIILLISTLYCIFNLNFELYFEFCFNFNFQFLLWILISTLDCIFNLFSIFNFFFGFNFKQIIIIFIIVYSIHMNIKSFKESFTLIMDNSIRLLSGKKLKIKEFNQVWSMDIQKDYFYSIVSLDRERIQFQANNSQYDLILIIQYEYQVIQRILYFEARVSQNDHFPSIVSLNRELKVIQVIITITSF